MKTFMTSLAAATACLATPCAAVTAITFANVPGTVGTSIASYTESGYTFTTTSGSLTAQNEGNSPLLGTTSTATVDLTYSGGTFQLLSLGSYAKSGVGGSGSIGYTGFLAGGAVFSGSVSAQSFGGFLYVAIPSITVDRVTLTLNRGTAAAVDLGYSTVTPAAAPPPVAAALPEPATWGMTIVGFGATGGTMRRRQRTAARIRCA